MAKSEKKSAARPIFFGTPNEFKKWLAKNHARLKEQWVGFYRRVSGRPGITVPQAVEEALCVGWIDGLVKGIDAQSYMIRFTPRKPTSAWSKVNIGRVAVLLREGRMRPAGLKAFAARQEAKSGIYSYEQRRKAKLDPTLVRHFQAKPKAWKFFQAQPEGYRTMMTWRIMSGKREETRRKRLEQLIAESQAGRRIPYL